MAKIISGLRVARSLVTPSGASIVSRELDFQLGASQGIEISSVLPYGFFVDISPTASDTVPATEEAIQSLHLETGTLETPPLIAAADEDDIDTEIFWVQSFHTMFQIPSTAGGGGGFGVAMPQGITKFAEPIRTARNITHRGQTFVTDGLLSGGVLIYYHYIEFTNAELGFLLARRQ